MPVGPIRQEPINRVDGTPPEKNSSAPQAEFALKSPATPQNEAPTPASIGAQIVQDARSAKTAGKEAPLEGPMKDLVNAVTSQLGVEHLSEEDKQKLAAQLAEDPVVKTLIG